jgi:hypothetical protein
VKPGDNFMAIILRSEIEIEKNNGEKVSLSYIVKCLLSTVFNEDMVSGYSAFPKEKKMYAEILPAFEKLYENVGVDMSFGPKCYFETDFPTQIIVLEDLSHYKMLPKSNGLDESHIEECLAWLAKFHAASMVYYDMNGPYGDLFKGGVYARDMESTYQPYFDLYFPYFIEAVKKLPNGEKYLEKVKKYEGKLYRSISKTLDFDENSVNVLCHGDSWSNNFLFLYENDKLKNLKVVDYQLPVYGTFTQDIFYFMMTSWHQDVKIKKFDYFIKFYHDNLVENLTLLKYEKKIPSLDDLHKEIDKRKFVLAAFIVELVPFPICPVEISTKIDDEILQVFYNNPKCERAFAEIFPWLDAREALDSPNLD